MLDLANPDAYRHVRGQMADLIRELGIDYIKWDHNRDVTEPVHDGHYGLHAQTEAAYRLFDDLKAEFPGLEIESCASGGGRTDAGILQHADRIWASDSNDPRDRVDIQRTTELVVPPEMIGAHIGPSPAHSTWRATDLSYRAAMSLEGCSGFEWNILECTDDEIAPPTACSTTSRPSSPASRSKAALRAAAAPTQGSCSTPTASGRPIRMTRATAWTSSAPQSSWCRPRCSARTSALARRIPGGARPT